MGEMVDSRCVYHKVLQWYTYNITYQYDIAVESTWQMLTKTVVRCKMWGVCICIPVSCLWFYCDGTVAQWRADNAGYVTRICHHGQQRQQKKKYGRLLDRHLPLYISQCLPLNRLDVRRRTNTWTIHTHTSYLKRMRPHTAWFNQPNYLVKTDSPSALATISPHQPHHQKPVWSFAFWVKGTE